VKITITQEEKFSFAITTIAIDPTLHPASPNGRYAIVVSGATRVNQAW